MNDKPNPIQTRSVELFKADGATFSSISAEIRSGAELVINGYDCGPMCQEVYSHDDVDSEVVVLAEHKDQLLLALLKEKFGGDSMASSRIREFLNSNNVPYDFDIWP